MIAYILIAFVALRKEKFAFAGFCFAIAALIKLYPLYLAVYLFTIRKYRCLTWMIFYFSVGSLLCYLIVGEKQILEYYIHKIPENSFLSGEAPFNFSLYSSLMYLFQLTKWSIPLLKFSSWKILYYAIAGLLSLPFFKIWYTKSKVDESALFFYSLLSMLLISPILWTHMLVILIPAYFYYFSSTSNSYKLLLCSLFFSALPLIPINQFLLPKITIPFSAAYLGIFKLSCLSVLLLLLKAYSELKPSKA